mgnify:FL=1
MNEEPAKNAKRPRSRASTLRGGRERRARFFRLSLLLFILQVSSFNLLFADPSWWVSRGVSQTNAPVADYAPVVLGQLKWIATNACDELEAGLPSGAGTSLWAMVQSFPALSNDWLAVNVGQVKAVGKPFHDRLIAAGHTTVYPWTPATTDDVDFAMANIGQVKNLFNFDLMGGLDSNTNSLPDCWEIRWFGCVTNISA